MVGTTHGFHTRKMKTWPLLISIHCPSVCLLQDCILKTFYCSSKPFLTLPKLKSKKILKGQLQHLSGQYLSDRDKSHISHVTLHNVENIESARKVRDLRNFGIKLNSGTSIESSISCVRRRHVSYVQFMHNAKFWLSIYPKYSGTGLCCLEFMFVVSRFGRVPWKVCYCARPGLWRSRRRHLPSRETPR